MSFARNERRAHAAWLTGLILALVVAQSSGAEASGPPFAALAGSWAGRGTLITLAGTEEARCAASYQPGGDEVKLTLKCATPSYRLDLTSLVRDENGLLSGRWAEQGFGTSGTVTGRAEGDGLALATNVMGAQVTVFLITRRGKQSVSIRTTSPFVRGGDLLLVHQR